MATEAFIYAEMEKANPTSSKCHSTNRFFRDADGDQAIRGTLSGHYKAMNPNMPKFNEIPNPYYLDKNK